MVNNYHPTISYYIQLVTPTSPLPTAPSDVPLASALAVPPPCSDWKASAKCFATGS